MPAIIRPYEDSDLDAVRTLFVRINRELAPAHLISAFEDYIARSLIQEIERIPAYYGERYGSFWVATEGSKLVGMFGLERVDTISAELRRMYVDAGARHRGLGRYMLRFAEDVARREHCAVMMLSTSELQSAAIALYYNAGFRLLREAIGEKPSNKTVGGEIRRFYFAKNL